MNLTLKIPDELVLEARHLAIDERSSLSAIVTELLDARVKEAKKQQTQKAPDLAESLLLPEEPAWFSETGFPLQNRDVVPLTATRFRFEPDPDE
jgi:N-acetylglutamate synthase-like GNAT family acetyltransferase